MATAGVFKQRYRFHIADCAIELDELHINGARQMSLAIESVQPGTVMRLRHQLGLKDWRNTAYPLAIDRILGCSPLPEELYYNAFS